MSGEVQVVTVPDLGWISSRLFYWTVDSRNAANWNALSKRISIRFKAESEAFTSTLNYWERLLGPCD